MKKRIWLAVMVVLCLSMMGGCSVINRVIGGEGYAVDGYAEGRLQDTMHTYFFDYTVNAAYLCDAYEGYQPSKEGYQLLVTDVTIKNTFHTSIPMYDTDFQVQWGSDDDEAYSVPITYYSEAVSEQQLPAEYDLAIDETRSGLLVFEVPAGLQDFSVSYLEAFDDGTEGDVFFVYFTADKQV